MSVAPPNKDNYISPPPANKTDISSLPDFINDVAVRLPLIEPLQIDDTNSLLTAPNVIQSSSVGSGYGQSSVVFRKIPQISYTSPSFFTQFESSTV
ncbi:MAG: hypothetical protein EZS28_056228, partial [Streblomastix strix]